MTNQHWSVVLETFSFFFVAIDLYGRERLERMHFNLVAGGRKLSSVLDRIQTYSWRDHGNRIFIVAVYGVAIVPTAIIFYRTGFPNEFFENGVTVGGIVTTAAMFAMFYVLILLIILVALALVLFLCFFFFWIARVILGALIHTIQITRFEGLLLIVGSLLFVLSKYLQLLAA